MSGNANATSATTNKKAPHLIDAGPYERMRFSTILVGMLYKDSKNMRHDNNDFIKFLVAFITVLTLMVMCSCSTTRVVGQTEVKTDSIYYSSHWLDSLVRSIYEKDSVYIHDSVNVEKAGDTVLIEKIHYRDRWRVRVDTILQYRYIHDTTYIERSDSTQVVVEKKPGLLARLRTNLGYLLLGICLFGCVILFVRGRA